MFGRISADGFYYFSDCLFFVSLFIPPREGKRGECVVILRSCLCCCWSPGVIFKCLYDIVYEVMCNREFVSSWHFYRDMFWETASHLKNIQSVLFIKLKITICTANIHWPQTLDKSETTVFNLNLIKGIDSLRPDWSATAKTMAREHQAGHRAVFQDKTYVRENV